MEKKSALSFLILMTLVAGCGGTKVEDKKEEKEVLPEIGLTEQDAQGDTSFAVMDGQSWTITLDAQGKEIVPDAAKNALFAIYPEEVEICEKISESKFMGSPAQAFDPDLLKKRVVVRTDVQSDKTLAGQIELETRIETRIDNEINGRFKTNAQINRALLNGSQENLIKPGVAMPQGISVSGFYDWNFVADNVAILRKTFDDVNAQYQSFTEIALVNPSSMELFLPIRFETSGIKSMRRISAVGKIQSLERGFYFLTGNSKLVDSLRFKNGVEEWEATFSNGVVRNIFVQENVIRTNKLVGESISDYCSLVEVSRERVYLYKENQRPFFKSIKKMVSGTSR